MLGRDGWLNGGTRLALPCWICLVIRNGQLGWLKRQQHLATKAYSPCTGNGRLSAGVSLSTDALICICSLILTWAELLISTCDFRWYAWPAGYIPPMMFWAVSVRNSIKGCYGAAKHDSYGLICIQGVDSEHADFSLTHKHAGLKCRNYKEERRPWMCYYTTSNCGSTSSGLWVAYLSCYYDIHIANMSKQKTCSITVRTLNDGSIQIRY